MAIKRYDQNFKTKALKLSDDIGIKIACKQLNLNYGNPAKWIKLLVKINKNENIDKNLQKENGRLKKELEKLKIANEILKDTLIFSH